MRRSTVSCLLAILALALFLRLSPVTRFVYFGSDVGEYFLISKGLHDLGVISQAYLGWGITYPYFPGMFFPVVAMTFGGLELSGSLDLVVPALGALTPVIVFLLGTRFLREGRAGLVAAAFVAIAMPHAFLTVHPAPAAIGSLFAVTALLLYILLPRDGRTWALLLPLTAALIMTHHLSTYFLLVMLLVATGVSSLVGVRRPAPSQVLYLAILGALTFGYWLGYATTFRTAILTDVDVQPWWLPLAALPLAVAVLSAAIILRGRSTWRYRPSFATLRHRLVAYGLVLLTAIAVMGAAVVVGIPGTGIRLTTSTFVFFLPFYVFFAFAGAGRREMDFARGGLAVTGWLVALVVSTIVGILAAPRVLIPYRHVEYVVLVFALFVGAGFSRLAQLVSPARGHLPALALAALLVVGGAATAIPPAQVVSGFEEGIRPEALNVAYWSGGRIDGLLATDHRASTLTFGFGGVDATWDRARLTLVAGSFDEARLEMESIASPSGLRRVDFVLIDADLARGVQLFPWEPANPLTAAALEKFGGPPYIKIFDSGYARLYWVNWALAP